MLFPIKEVAFVGYPTADIARARSFYEGTLGLSPSLAAEVGSGVWWVEYELGGTTLALSNAWPSAGPGGPTFAFEVEDFPAALAKLQSAGIALTFGPMETPVCHMAGFKDPDGNDLLVHHRKHG